MRTAKVLAILCAVLIAGALLHRLVLGALNKAMALQDYLFAYGINYIMAAAIIVTLFNLPEKFKISLGYFFLFGSFFKFIVYFLVFLPMYRSDGEVTKVEFFAFFVPYALGLMVETIALITKLKADDKGAEKPF